MNDKHKITDQDINTYLEGNAQVSKDYAASESIKSPEHLDTLVKKMAHDAHNSENTNANNIQWVLPTAIAASIILVIGVVLKAEFKGDQDKTQIAFDKNPKIEEADSAIDNKSSIKNIANNKVIPQPSPEQDSVGKEPEVVAENKDDFKMPEGFDTLLQNTGAGSHDKLPPDTVLKQWTHEQWKQQVKELKAAQKNSLAQKYIDKFLEFYPEDKMFASEK